MQIKSVAGLVLVRRRMIALQFGDAMGKPLFGGVVSGLAACGALSGDPQVDDLSHAKPRALSFPRQLRRYGGESCCLR
jgi:hypothetical protein